MLLKLRFYLNWIGGILFALIGLVGLFTNFIFGLALLIVAFILIPKTSKIIENKLKFKLTIIRKIGIIFLCLIVSGIFIDYNNTTNTINQKSTNIANQQTKNVESKNSIYKIEENDLNIIIDTIPDKEFGSMNIEILDIRYALQRLINEPIYNYPFYAMKDPNNNGYIGIIKGKTGEAIFLLSIKSLNDINTSDLEKSIKAINGTATTYNRNIKLAGLPYEPYEILKLVK